jgi:hypothetical protein
MGSKQQHIDRGLGKRRLLLSGAAIYAATIVFCGFGAAYVPATLQKELGPYLWLLGPAANLVYGTSFLWPFVIGTIAVTCLFVGVVRSRSGFVKGVCAFGLALAWIGFGFFVYAPVA